MTLGERFHLVLKLFAYFHAQFEDRFLFVFADALGEVVAPFGDGARLHLLDVDIATERAPGHLFFFEIIGQFEGEGFFVFDAQPDGMGKSQLFVSFRAEDGGWTRARPFDSTINATYTENIPHVSPDGKYFFFHRNNDIYWVDAAVIARLR